MKMDELKKTTWKAAIAIGIAMLMVFVCVFRTSNVTTLVILLNFALLGVVSVVTRSRLRYLLVVALTGLLALELALYHEGKPAISAAFFASVLVRFFLVALLVAYFSSVLTEASHRIYFDARRLADERQEALSVSQRLLSRLNALVEVISAISTRNELKDVLSVGLEQTRKVFNADSGLVYRVSRAERRLLIMSSFGYSDELLDKMMEKGVTFASSCEACGSMKPVAVDNLATDEKCPNLARVTSGSSICLPIISEDNLWGVLHIRRRNPDAFTAEDVQLAQAVAYQFALAMQRAYLFDEVNLLAITDPVTELYNHRKMTRDLDREVVRSKRYMHEFSFIMADIDFFKDFNDTYGHQAGDAVLHEAARELDSGRREVDRVYRYGGEEFAILLPETSGREAFDVAEKLRRRVESMKVAVEGLSEPLSITISMGVASFPGDGRDIEPLVEAADEALYRAKQSGRNRVIAHRDRGEGHRARGV